MDFGPVLTYTASGLSLSALRTPRSSGKVAQTTLGSVNQGLSEPRALPEGSLGAWHCDPEKE